MLVVVVLLGCITLGLTGTGFTTVGLITTGLTEVVVVVVTFVTVVVATGTTPDPQSLEIGSKRAQVTQARVSTRKYSPALHLIQSVYLEF